MEPSRLDAFFDQARLRGDAYADSTKLMARADIYRFAVPETPFPTWALSKPPRHLGDVLDVGCGPGVYLKNVGEAVRATSLVGVDLSAGMRREARGHTPSLCAADAQALPFRTDSFDTALCLHVLYHVPDIPLAVSELRRVVKPGGCVLVGTNGSRHQRTIREFFDQVVSELSEEPAEPLISPEIRFNLEEGSEVLKTQFDSVQKFELDRELVVPDTGPVVRFLESIRSPHEAWLPPGLSWDEVVEAFRLKVEAEIGEKGAFRSPILAGVFVCR